ncbi:MAG: MerR family transcriptional regulator [Marmoricola sp.]|jgi:MerR family transcriptional regulator/heat shock protein HspR|nr:MerR family transcriptional regulator [Marmoricola sp.]
MPTRGPQGGQGRNPRVPGPTVPVYVISVAAELTGLHAQTLRQYDRVGLVSPGRTAGGGRRYSLRDIELLREVAELTAAGIGLEGVRRILELEHQVAALRSRNSELRSQVAELQAALEATLTSLKERRPNLPALRQPGGQPGAQPGSPLGPLNRFGDRR